MTTRRFLSIILYTERQLEDIRCLCCAGPAAQQTVLGIDKTFNLGQLHVSIMVFKNISLVRQATLTHPLFLGPILIHGNSDWRTFASFFSAIDVALGETPSSPVIGSDEETAIRKAARFVFKNAKLMSCHRHLKANATSQLRDKVGTSLDVRGRLVSAMFGELGLTKANTIAVFEVRHAEILQMIRDLAPGFEIYYSQRLYPVIQENLATTLSHPDVPLDWTNNNCESVNHILKMKTQWTPQDIPTLINTLYDTVEATYIDVERAIMRRGEFRLDPVYRKFEVDPIIWCAKTNEQRERHTSKFLKTPKILKDVSTVGDIHVLRGPSRGRKPSQKKRCRAARTTTLS